MSINFIHLGEITVGMNTKARFVELDVSGKPLQPAPAPVGARLEPGRNLMWGPTLDRQMMWEEAEKACAEYRLFGFDDWRMPTVEELFGLADRSRVDPAIDVDAFPDTKSTWYWTSTPYAPVLPRPRGSSSSTTASPTASPAPARASSGRCVRRACPVSNRPFGEMNKAQPIIDAAHEAHRIQTLHPSPRDWKAALEAISDETLRANTRTILERRWREAKGQPRGTQGSRAQGDSGQAQRGGG